jgi:hypothetical protein
MTIQVYFYTTHLFQSASKFVKLEINGLTLCGDDCGDDLIAPPELMQGPGFLSKGGGKQVVKRADKREKLGSYGRSY